MPRILLVDANDSAKWIGGGTPYEVHIPPIGLMYLASTARQILPRAELRIVDSSLDCPTDEDYARILNDFRPDIIGIRSIIFFLEEVQRIARVSGDYGHATIVAGGPVVQALKERLFQEVPQIDLAAKGEGEAIFGQILSGRAPSDIRGILYRNSETVIENEDAKEIADIDAIPHPAYDLIDLDRYQRHLSYAFNHRRQGILLTSRGCVFDCTFCFNHWKQPRFRSAEDVFREIEELHSRYDVADFYIIDDIFNINLKRALSVFEKIVSAGLRVRIYFANGLRADTATEEFVDKAIEAGAIWFTYAIESGSERIQAFIRKRLNLEKARRIISYTQRQNVVVNVCTMFGFPTETNQDAQTTLDYLGGLPKPPLLPYHFCLRFFPGCDINQQALEAGFHPARLDFTSRFSYNDLPVGTPTLPKSDMLRIILDYHERFGLHNRQALAGAVGTLRSVGYSDTEIVHMYSILKRNKWETVDELLASVRH